MRVTATLFALFAVAMMSVLAARLITGQFSTETEEERATSFMLWCARHAGRASLTATRIDGRLKYHASCHHGGGL